ncbi:MAG: ferrochelatase, partial [Alphaproteobacteria bacterium]|nr:ferrochelatase [Alphaproteobacteria bacterium]
PQKTIARGDPYQLQVERTAAAIVDALAGETFESVVCYQSRVGPLEWIRPYLEDELRRAAADGVPVIIAPIAFVSEHSETLVELDIEYREMAEELGIRAYERVATVGVEPAFVAGLGRLVQQAVAADAPLLSDGGGRFCPGDFRGCAFGRVR